MLEGGSRGVAGVRNSSLDTHGITRQVPESLAKREIAPWPGPHYGDREGWLDQVLELTRSAREKIAADHRARARCAETVGARIWHEQRAAGAEERGYRLHHCGERSIETVCRGCGSVHEDQEIQIGCGHGLLCHDCRKRRIAKLRRRLNVAAEAATERAAEHGYKARFLTLTLPHSGDVARDIEAIPKAWARLLREIQRRHGRLEFVRVLEWTPGTQGDGHPHAHVLIYGPYLSREWLSHWWGHALAMLDYEVPTRTKAEVLDHLQGKRREYAELELPEQCYNLQVDVRLCDPKTINVELAKYLVKDLLDGDENGNTRVDAALFAEAYLGLLGRRCIQTSRGYWVIETYLCPHCEEPHDRYVYVRMTPREKAKGWTEEPRGPPS